MLTLDHLTIIAPTLAEGVSHVRTCLDIDVPFGTKHTYMGTHNHRLQLGQSVYLEIVALDPDGMQPSRARWFGLDDQINVRKDWDEGRRLRGWVASVIDIESVCLSHPGIFGEKVQLPFDKPEFDFAIPEDGTLPLKGAIPSLIDHRGNPTSMAEIPDLGAKFHSFSLQHPNPEVIMTLYWSLKIDRPPNIMSGSQIRYSAQIETPSGMKELT